jgi:hypothetical protein
MTVSAATRFIPSPPALNAQQEKTRSIRVISTSLKSVHLFTAIERRLINTIDCPSYIINSPFLMRIKWDAADQQEGNEVVAYREIFTSIMSSMVVNWLNSNILCPRLNSSRSSKRRTIIPLAFTTSSSPKTGHYRVFGSIGQSNRKLFRSCMTVFSCSLHVLSLCHNLCASGSVTVTRRLLYFFLTILFFSFLSFLRLLLA